MQRGSARFLQAIIVLAAAGAMTLMLWEPHTEGRNAHATTFAIYFHDPFLAYAYVASVPFFVALYQALKVVGYAGKGEIFSRPAVHALRMIRFCAIAVVAFVAAAEAYIVMLSNSDDPSGGIAVGVLIAFGSTVVAAAAAIGERIAQHGVDLKSENDLTV
jgi:hypothetical protein